MWHWLSYTPRKSDAKIKESRIEDKLVSNDLTKKNKIDITNAILFKTSEHEVLVLENQNSNILWNYQEPFNNLYSMSKFYNFIQRLQVHVEILPIQVIIHCIHGANYSLNLILPHIELKSSNTKLVVANIRNKCNELNIETGS